MKKVLLLLLAASFYCSLAAVSLFAAETILYTGDTSMLQTVGGHANSLAPSGSSSGKSGSLSGNSVTVSSNVLGFVYGAININDSQAVTGNSITINTGTISGVVYGSYSDKGNVENNSVIMNNGQVTLSVTGGANYGVGDVINNRVTINGGKVSTQVIGGYIFSSGNGNIANNSVIIKGGNMVSDVYGGCTIGNGNVTNNSVIISGGIMNSHIYGGYVNGSGNVTNNSVTIDSSTGVKSIYGGRSNTGNAAGNSITVNGGTAANVIYGGYANGGAATGNIITINGGTVSGNIVGGYVETDSFATGNTIIINGGTINSANIYGGYCNTAGGVNARNNNTITISGSPTFVETANIFGGYGGDTDRFTGNTLNVVNYTGSSFGRVQRFQYYNFTFSGNQSGPVIKVGTAYLGYDVTPIGSSVTAVNTIAGTPVFKAGSSVTLIQAVTITTYGFSQTQTEGTHGLFVSYNWTLEASTITKKLTATVAGVKAVQETKIISEGAAAGAILAGQGADLSSGGLLSNLQEGKIEAVASVFGGNSKYKTGSSVEMSVFSAAAGIAKKFGSFSAGIFAEYASGSFDTEYKILTGDGSASAVGGGILAKKDINESIYIECAARAGQLTNDYKANISGTAVDFDYSTMYFGFGLSIGKIFKVSETMSIDCFGKYALTNTGESETNLASGEKYKMDSILSNRIKAGAKSEFKATDALKPYITLTYDYELSGDINAQMDGLDIEAPTLNGGTFSAAIGASAKITEKVTLDISGQFYSGVREGLTGSLKAKYEF